MLELVDSVEKEVVLAGWLARFLSTRKLLLQMCVRKSQP